MTTLENRPQTALAVIDVQTGVVADAHGRDQVVANIATLVHNARAAGTPVVWVLHNHPEHMPRESDGWQLVPELAIADGEAVVDKQYGDSFEDTDLEDVLAGLGVGRLVVSGRGSAWPCDLGAPAQPLPVSVVLRLDDTRFCAAFGGSVSRNTAGRFVATDAPPPGACLSFLLARYAARTTVARWMEPYPALGRIDRAVARHGARIVMITRLVPIFPFNLQNYAYGLTSIGFGAYAISNIDVLRAGTFTVIPPSASISFAKFAKSTTITWLILTPVYSRTARIASGAPPAW